MNFYEGAVNGFKHINVNERLYEYERFRSRDTVLCSQTQNSHSNGNPDSCVNVSKTVLLFEM